MPEEGEVRRAPGGSSGPPPPGFRVARP